MHSIKKGISICLFLLISGLTFAQSGTLVQEELDGLKKYNEKLDHRMDRLQKMVDDLKVRAGMMASGKR